MAATQDYPVPALADLLEFVTWCHGHATMAATMANDRGCLASLDNIADRAAKVLGISADRCQCCGGEQNAHGRLCRECRDSLGVDFACPGE